MVTRRHCGGSLEKSQSWSTRGAVKQLAFTTVRKAETLNDAVCWRTAQPVDANKARMAVAHLLIMDSSQRCSGYLNIGYEAQFFILLAVQTMHEGLGRKAARSGYFHQRSCSAISTLITVVNAAFTKRS